jgi:hypothetical protein
VTTLLYNHYHTVGYLKKGEELGAMMRKLHGSVADQRDKRIYCAICPRRRRRYPSLNFP